MQQKTIEEYCRAIGKIEENEDNEGIRSLELAKKLKLAKNTVALTLRKLSASGYIVMEKCGKIKLTKKGNGVAKKMNFKHRVLEAFLFSKLKMGIKKIHNEACVLEHSASDEMVRKLYEFMGRPKLDPHGKLII